MAFPKQNAWILKSFDLTFKPSEEFQDDDDDFIQILVLMRLVRPLAITNTKIPRVQYAKNQFITERSAKFSIS